MNCIKDNCYFVSITIKTSPEYMCIIELENKNI